MESNRLIDLVYLRALNDRHVSEAADTIELLQRELKCSKEMWEQQQELALEYLADIEKANERVAELEQEIDDYETTYKGSVVEAQAKRIAELEKEIDCWHEAANWPGKSPLQLRARIAELEAALKPFAEANTPEDMIYIITLGELRQARKVLGDKEWETVANLFAN